ncbi:MAG: YbaK/EbsC family protein [Bacillota bacterium]|nr:YbaK/EbsC family protein [Bacillota bacterium]
MSVESVRQFFINRGISDPIIELNDSGTTVELASKIIGVDPSFIAKTLAFKLKDKNVLIVTKGDGRINNKKYRQFFKEKAKMVDFNDVEEITGHPVGGVCPFGLKNSLEIYLDLSIKDFQYVYPAAGSKNYAMKISPNEIHSLTNATWIDVCE